MKILLVESSRGLSKALSIVFKNNNYDYETTYDGVQAINVMNDSFSYVIIDEHLSRISYKEVILKIKKINNNAKIILIADKVNIDEEILFRNLVVDEYITKPFTSKLLLDLISELDYSSNNELIVKIKEKYNLTIREMKLLEKLKDETSKEEIEEIIMLNRINIYTYIDVLNKKIKHLGKKINKSEKGYRIENYDK